MQNVKDDRLWAIAQRRVAFKYHLTSYIIMNIFFWILWFFADWRNSINEFPWPVWPMVTWGVGLLFHYLGAYVLHNKNSVESEYEKLLQANKK